MARRILRHGLIPLVLLMSVVLGVPHALDAIMLQNYDQTKIPVNKEGVSYPTDYQQGAVGGAFTLALDPEAAPTSTGQSLLITLATPSSELYAQFNPYDGRGRGFTHEYAACGYPSACGNAADWHHNTYTKLRFWLKVPIGSSPPSYTGQGNCNVGLYNKNITNANGSVDEGGGGGHFYHSFTVEPTGTWWQVILNMHPDHERGINHVDPGYMPYPTTADPPKTYNYWDTLTRFYIQCNAPAGGPWKLDQLEFVAAPTEDDVHLASALVGTYVPSSNTVMVNWERRIPEEGNWDVRYAFSDIHALGWANATPAPGSPVTPGWGSDYVQVHYASAAIPTTGQSTVYVAVRSQLESAAFNQIAIPLTAGAPQPPEPPQPPVVTVPHGTSQLVWTWTKGPAPNDLDAQEFRIGCGTQSGVLSLPVKTYPPTGRTAPIKDLVPGAGTYYCIVTAWNGAKVSPPSSEVSFTVESPAERQLAAPVNVRIVAP